jgi:hypothetical protein
VPHRYVGDVWRAGRAADRILHDSVFWAVTVGAVALSALGCLRARWISRARLADLLGLMALGELAWQGVLLIQVAPAGLFFRPDPVSESLILANRTLPLGNSLRIRARDAFFADLQAVRYGIEKTNINDLCQIQHAAVLYERLYPVAAPRQAPIDDPMNLAVEDFKQRVRQGVFDRMAVTALVSDRIEPDPTWPVKAHGRIGKDEFVIQENPAVLPRAYLVPRAEIVPSEPDLILSRFRYSNPQAAVIMNHDPLADLPAQPRQNYTPALWLSHDPDRPMLEVTSEAPGLLVMADTWFPGWNAWVDGQREPILRGNWAQRVIPLRQPGRHTITFQYTPPGLARGAWLTLLGALSWGLAAAAFLRKHRGAGHRGPRPGGDAQDAGPRA